MNKIRAKFYETIWKIKRVIPFEYRFSAETTRILCLPISISYSRNQEDSAMKWIDIYVGFLIFEFSFFFGKKFF